MKTKFGLHWCIFNHCDIIDPQS